MPYVDTSNYKSDSRAEHELSKFIQDYYMVPMNEKGWPQRVFSAVMTNSKIQKEGIDLTFRDMEKGETWYIDMKALLLYINVGMPNFLFELGFYLRGDKTKPTDGWLLAKGNKTTHYLIMWPWATEADAKKGKGQGFHEGVLHVHPEVDASALSGRARL